MNRREWLAGAGALAASACASTGPGGNNRDPLSGDALMADVRTYVNFGTHRSGSPGDIATSDWFAAHWRKLGYSVDQPAFDIPNADTTRASLELGGQRFDGFAQPPIAFTPPGGLVAEATAQLTAANGSIVVIPMARPAVGPMIDRPSFLKAVDAAARAGAKAVVAIIDTAPGEVGAINTPNNAQPTIPVLSIGRKDQARLTAALAKGGSSTLRIEGPGSTEAGARRRARNTIARHGKAGPWIIVSTPQSGWFTCGGERGPGIAMSRALSQWAVTTNAPCRWLFIATSGHEWVDTGAHIFHETPQAEGGAPDPADTALWLHLGASYGARDYAPAGEGVTPLPTANAARSFMVTPDLQASVRAAFAGQPQLGDPMLSNPKTALGEVRLVIDENYPTSAGFWGGHALFHTPIDTAEATSPAIMEPIARSLVAMIEARLKKL